MKIQLKRSNQLEGGEAKKPSVSQMEYGELAVNYNTEDPALFIKDSADQIVKLKIAPAATVLIADTAPDISDSEIGTLWWNSSEDSGQLFILYDDPSGGGGGDVGGPKWIEASPTTGGSGSGGAEVLVSETAPVIDDLEEGSLWWNSSSTDLQLYVLYNDNGTKKWVEASPTVGDAGSEDDFVNVTGDNMTGDLTLGTDKITLDASDGSAKFASNLQLNGNASGSENTKLKPTTDGGVNIHADADNNASDDTTIKFSVKGVDPAAYFDKNGYFYISEFGDGDTDVGLRFSGRPNSYGRMEIKNSSGASDTSINIASYKGESTAANRRFALYANGSADFTGGVDSEDFFRVVNSDPTKDTSGSLISKGLFRAIRASGSGAGTNVFEGYLAGTLTSNIGMDGSTTFKGNVVSGDNTPDAITGKRDYTVLTSYGLAAFYRDGNTDGITHDFGAVKVNVNGTTAGDYSGGGETNYYSLIQLDKDGTSNWSIKTDGAATFASEVEVYRGTTNASPALLIGFSNYGSVKKRQFVISASGSGTFEGPLFQNGSTPVLAADSAVLWTEPDDPANYTTTTDSEGNETSVYNGPTLDVKERLQNLISRLDSLESDEIADDATSTLLLTTVNNINAQMTKVNDALTAIRAAANAAGTLDQLKTDIAAATADI